MLSAGLRRGAPLRAAVAPACCKSKRWSSSSAAKSVAVVPGDGIGPEVMDEAIKVLDAVASVSDLSFAYETALVGGAAWDNGCVPFPG